MEKIKDWFKDTTFYYWIVLVLWRAIVQAIPIKEIRAKIMETIIALIVSLLLLYFWNIVYPIPILGVNLLTFIIALGVTVMLRIVGGIINIPVQLNKEKKDELTKYNWDKVKITPVPYSTVWRAGYAIRISNNKIFDISRINISLFSVEIDETPRPKPNRAYYFQSIDYEEHSFSYLDDDGVKSGKEKDYAITELLTTRGKTTCKLYTSRKDDDDYIGYLFRNKSGKIIKDRSVIITVSITGVSIKIGNEIHHLPILHKKYQIMPDGKIIER